MPNDRTRIKANPQVMNRPTQAQLAEHEFRLQQERDRDAKMSEIEQYESRPRYVGSSDVELEPSDARISSQLAFMVDQLDELSSLLYELEERVNPILLPPFAEPSDPDVPGQATSEISRLIDVHNGRITELQRRVRHINRRVQL